MPAAWCGAYSDAVRCALDDAGVVQRPQVRLLDVTLDHAAAARIEHDLRARGIDVRDVRYAGQGATLRLGAPDPAVADVEALLARETRGAVPIRHVGIDLIDVPAPGPRRVRRDRRHDVETVWQSAMAGPLLTGRSVRATPEGRNTGRSARDDDPHSSRGGSR